MPDWNAHLRSRLAQLRLSPAREVEIMEELSQHLDQRYEELREGGASDTETFPAVAAVLALTAVLSSLGPAWQAVRIGPAVMLRQE